MYKIIDNTRLTELHSGEVVYRTHPSPSDMDILDFETRTSLLPKDIFKPVTSLSKLIDFNEFQVYPNEEMMKQWKNQDFEHRLSNGIIRAYCDDEDVRDRVEHLLLLMVEGLMVQYRSFNPFSNHADAIFVAGGHSLERPKAAYEVWCQGNRCANIVVSGRAPQRELPSMKIVETEADRYAAYLISKGVPDRLIAREQLATNTVQNVEFSIDLIEKILQEKNSRSITVVLVTSASHMARFYLLVKTELAKRRIWWNVLCFPAKEDGMYLPNECIPYVDYIKLCLSEYRKIAYFCCTGL